MAIYMKDHDTANYYKGIVTRGRKVYIDALWNGKYFNYDSSNSVHHDR